MGCLKLLAYSVVFGLAFAFMSYGFFGVTEYLVSEYGWALGGAWIGFWFGTLFAFYNLVMDAVSRKG